MPSGSVEERERELHRPRVERVAFDAGDAGLLDAGEQAVEVGHDEGEKAVPHGGVDAALLARRRGVDAEELEQAGTDSVADQRRARQPQRRVGGQREHLGVEVPHRLDVVGHDPDVERAAS